MTDPNLSCHRGALEGGKVFIPGNGPSILTHDLARLKHQHSIGMNASPLLEQEYGFTSDYYTVSDTRFIADEQKRELATRRLSPKTLRFLRLDLRHLDARDLADRTWYVRSLGKNGFSHDLRRGFYFGCTTSMLAIQLAAYLSCRHIFLLGNDLRYPRDRPRFYEEAEPQSVDPFLSVQIWSIRNAKLELDKRGVDLYICTRDSNLAPYIPFISFEDALEL